jgi:hypothetical protein
MQKLKPKYFIQLSLSGILNVLPSKIKMGRNWYQSTGTAFVLSGWNGHFYFILKGHHLRLSKNALPPLVTKLLDMLGRFSEALQIVLSKVLYTV